jgi:HlyD family secretion protein
MKKRSKAVIIIVIIAIVAAVAVAGYFLFRDKFKPSAAASTGLATGTPAGYTTVPVTRGDLSSSITASGQLQPNKITTIRPDSNMPTRKLQSLLVQIGSRVSVGQALAKVDASGLDLDLQSARATVDAQAAKLANLRAKPAGLDIINAQVDLTSTKNTLDSAQANYDGTKALADKGLASKNQLADAERQLAAAKERYSASQLSFESVKSQSSEDVIPSQEAALAQAKNSLQKAQLIYDSATIRSPVEGVVAEIPVNVGDLAGPSTAIMTVIDPDPMLLQAQINENDIVQVQVGQKVSITPSVYPDLQLSGTVKQISMRATVQQNVSVFQTTIEVPNTDGKLVWGMNADAEIYVLSLKNVLILPVSAIKTSNGTAQVSILDGENLISWDVQVGASDGTKTQIIAGLDEGEEVVVASKKSTTSSTQSANRQNQQQGGDLGGIMRVLR